MKKKIITIVNNKEVRTEKWSQCKQAYNKNAMRMCEYKTGNFDLLKAFVFTDSRV